MSTQTDALQGAIDRLGAKDLGNGRYATHASGRWLLVAADALIDADESGLGPIGKSVPAWWTPERQFAVRYPSGATSRYKTIDDARQYSAMARKRGAGLITVDLETGEEVAA